MGSVPGTLAESLYWKHVEIPQWEFVLGTELCSSDLSTQGPSTF